MQARHANKMQARLEERSAAERSINQEAQLIALRRKAAAWGANEDEESITGFSGRWEALSNWFPATVVHGGKQYPSVEHAFQAAKAAAEPDQAEAIRRAPTPKEAHALGQTVALPPGWERRRRRVMETLLRDKFRRDATLRERLLRTESKNLIASNGWGEAFWGVSGGNGANELGKLLMALRDEARAGEDVDAWLRASFELAEESVELAPLSLEQTRKGEPIEPVELGSAPLVFVGKHSACTLQLDHPSVSRRHAALLRDKERGLLVIDLASKAGTTLDGKRLPPSVGIPLRDGGVLVFGGSSRAYTVRLHERDALELLEAQHAALTAQLAALEKEANDPASFFGLLPASKRVDPDARTLFVGNLPYDASEDDLREAFEQQGCGEVATVRIPTDGESGQPRGIAFVEFANAADAREAIKRMDGEPLKGRSLKVNLSEKSAPKRAPPPPRPAPPPAAAASSSAAAAGAGAGGGFSGSQAQPPPPPPPRSDDRRDERRGFSGRDRRGRDGDDDRDRRDRRDDDRRERERDRVRDFERDRDFDRERDRRDRDRRDDDRRSPPRRPRRDSRSRSRSRSPDARDDERRRNKRPRDEGGRRDDEGDRSERGCEEPEHDEFGRVRRRNDSD